MSKKKQKNQNLRPTDEELGTLMRICMNLRDEAKVQLAISNNPANNDAIRLHSRSVSNQLAAESNVVVSVLKYFGVPGPDPMELCD